jgi:hypothetical protein
MSRENVEVVHRFYRAVERGLEIWDTSRFSLVDAMEAGDIPAETQEALGYLTPDAEWIPIFASETYRGQSQIARGFDELLEAVENYRLKLLEVNDLEGDRVLAAFDQPRGQVERDTCGRSGVRRRHAAGRVDCTAGRVHRPSPGPRSCGAPEVGWRLRSCQMPRRPPKSPYPLRAALGSKPATSEARTPGKAPLAGPPLSGPPSWEASVPSDPRPVAGEDPRRWGSTNSRTLRGPTQTPRYAPRGRRMYPVRTREPSKAGSSRAADRPRNPRFAASLVAWS